MQVVTTNDASGAGPLTSLVRQRRRYHPEPGDLYFELNQGISRELDQLKPMLKGKRCLDIGAGEMPFRDYYADLHVETCDINQNNQGTIQHMLVPNSPLPFQDQTYDVLFLFDVLEHVKDDVMFARECERIIKPGGFIIGNVPFLYRFHEIPDDYRRYTESGLRYLWHEICDLSIDRLVRLGSHLFIIETLLTECEVPRTIGRKIIYRILAFLTHNLARSDEVSSHTAFSYFFVASKRAT